MDVYISGVGLTKFGRLDLSLETLLAEVAVLALRDAGRDRTDAVFIGTADIGGRIEDSLLVSLIADHLGVSDFLSTPVQTVSPGGADLLETAIHGVANGDLKQALVLAGGRTTHLSRKERTRSDSDFIDRMERRYGINPPALAALMAQRYRKEHRLTLQQLEDVLSRIAVKNHCNGSLNGHTPFRKEMDREDYFKSRILSYPLRLHDCAPMTDGFSAILLTSEPSGVRVSGVGYGTDTSAFRYRVSLTSFKAVREAALMAYGMAQRNPSDIQFAEVYDAFTPLEVIGTEDLGLFRPGEGWRAVEDGTTQLKGRLPINPSGGIKSRAHPLMASFTAQIVEIVWQLRGQAGAGRQLEKTEAGLAQSIGGMGTGSLVAILEQKDRGKAWAKGWEPDYQPEINPPRSDRVPPPTEGRGTLETFTVLYATPDGFRSPLTLGLVQMEGGMRVLACNPDYRNPGELKMGQPVHLSMKEDLYIFEKKGLWDRFKDHWKASDG